MKGFLPMAGLALAAYVVGRQASRAVPAGGPHDLADLERRLADLEGLARSSESGSPADGPGRAQTDKEYTAFHYEALANQAAQEHRLDELDWRLRDIELRRHDARAVRCVSRQSATTGESRHG